MRKLSWAVVIAALVGVAVGGVILNSNSSASTATQASAAAPSTTIPPSDCLASPDGCVSLSALNRLRVQEGSSPANSANGAVGTISALPACVPVDISGKTVGCILKSTMMLNPDARDALQGSAIGASVYDLATQSTVVGYLSDIGFVPNSLVSRYSELKQCTAEANRAMQTGTLVSSSCHDLLILQGIDERFLNGSVHLGDPTAK